MFSGEVGGFDSGVGGGDCEVYACFCFVWLVEEATPDRGGLRESGEGGIGEFCFFPARGGFFGDALELGALEAVWEVAPVVVGGEGGKRAGEIMGAGGDGVSTLGYEELAGAEDHGEGRG